MTCLEREKGDFYIEAFTKVLNICAYNSLGRPGPWYKSLNFVFPTKHVIPESLKFRQPGWVSTTQRPLQLDGNQVQPSSCHPSCKWKKTKVIRGRPFVSRRAKISDPMIYSEFQAPLRCGSLTHMSAFYVSIGGVTCPKIAVHCHKFLNWWPSELHPDNTKQKQRCFAPVTLLMAEILHQLIQLIGSLSHYLQGFIHPRRCRISSINSISSRNL